MMSPFGQGGNMQSGSSSGYTGGNGQPPQGPQPPQDPVYTYDRPTQNEKREGYPGSLRPLHETYAYEDIEDFKLKNPSFYVPANANLLVDPRIDRNTFIGFYKNGNIRNNRFESFFMHTFHNKPIRVYMNNTPNSPSVVHPPLLVPKGFYLKYRTSGEYHEMTTCNAGMRGRTLYVRNSNNEFKEFPLQVANIKIVSKCENI